MKGVSPLVASVLLIAFTVAIATIIMGWMGTFTRETTSTISNRTTEAVDCASASINIDDVYISGSGSSSATARAIVRNTGFADNLVLKNAQLYNTTGYNFTNTSELDQDFDKGEILTISFGGTGLGTGISNTAFSRVTVSTTCGSVGDTFNGVPKTG